jgi:hypothetical protein
LKTEKSQSQSGRGYYRSENAEPSGYSRSETLGRGGQSETEPHSTSYASNFYRESEPPLPEPSVERSPSPVSTFDSYLEDDHLVSPEWHATDIAASANFRAGSVDSVEPALVNPRTAELKRSLSRDLAKTRAKQRTLSEQMEAQKALEDVAVGRSSSLPQRRKAAARPTSSAASRAGSSVRSAPASARGAASARGVSSSSGKLKKGSPRKAKYRVASIDPKKLGASN